MKNYSATLLGPWTKNYYLDQVPGQKIIIWTKSLDEKLSGPDPCRKDNFLMSSEHAIGPGPWMKQSSTRPNPSKKKKLSGSSPCMKHYHLKSSGDETYERCSWRRRKTPVNSCPAKIGQVSSAKAGERQEGSGLKWEAWGAREAQPGKVWEVLHGERYVKYLPRVCS